MERILITGTPEGEAPQELRESWIGLEIPISELAQSVRESGTKISPKNSGGYVVEARDLIQALKDRGGSTDLEMIQLLKGTFKNPDPGNHYFIFNPQFCELITD